MTTAARAIDDLTYADLQEIPDDGKTYQLFDGRLIVSPAPSPRHQLTLGHLFEQLMPAAAGLGGEVLFAPVDFVSGAEERTVLQPDLCVLYPGQIIGDGPFRSPPLLAVEVLSPSNRVRDLRVKSRHYAKFGVPNLWFLDPDWPSITANVLQAEHYAEVAKMEDAVGTFTAPPFTDLAIDLPRHWRGVLRD